jgi:hypothetical protein
VDRCLRCNRPAGKCRTASDCDAIHEERVRLMGRVVEAARDYRETVAARAARPWAGPCELETLARHVATARADLFAALRALDGEG